MDSKQNECNRRRLHFFCEKGIGNRQIEKSAYYALLPIIIGVVAPFGVAAQSVASAFLLTATFGTPLSPCVAAVYVGLGLADVSIGDHIKYSLRLVWPMSIITLLGATLLGVIPF